MDTSTKKELDRTRHHYLFDETRMDTVVYILYSHRQYEEVIIRLFSQPDFYITELELGKRVAYYQDSEDCGWNPIFDLLYKEDIQKENILWSILIGLLLKRMKQWTLPWESIQGILRVLQFLMAPYLST